MSEQSSNVGVRRLLFFAGGAFLGVIVGRALASGLGFDASSVYAGPMGASVGVLFGAVVDHVTRRRNG